MPTAEQYYEAYLALQRTKAEEATYHKFFDTFEASLQAQYPAVYEWWMNEHKQYAVAARAMHGGTFIADVTFEKMKQENPEQFTKFVAIYESTLRELSQKGT